MTDKVCPTPDEMQQLIERMQNGDADAAYTLGNCYRYGTDPVCA